MIATGRAAPRLGHEPGHHLLRGREVPIPLVEGRQAGHSPGVKDAAHDHLGQGAGRAELVEGRGSTGRERPLVGRVAEGPRRHDPDRLLRYRQLRGPERRGQQIEGPALTVGGHDPRGRARVAPHGVAVLHPPEGLDRGGERVAVVEVDRHEALVEAPHGLPGVDRGLVEGVDEEAPYRGHALQLAQHVGAVDPGRGGRVGVRGSGVGVRDEQSASLLGLPDDRLQALLLPALGEGRVAVADRQRVIEARAVPIGVPEGDPPVLELDQRRGIVHHRGAPVAGGDEVVGQPQGVADLVGRVLPAPRHGELLGVHVGVERREPVQLAAAAHEDLGVSPPGGIARTTGR